MKKTRKYISVCLCVVMFASMCLCVGCQKKAETIEKKKKTVNEIKDNISGMVVALAEKVVEKEINADDQQALIDQFIKEMGESA